MEASPAAIALSTVIKRKRGRPKKIIPPEKLIKRKTLSDYTKRKIAENNKKFSVCKLCKRQCRGFRGLVDHMHRDHSDYKPWQCTYCDHKTAFVKTLYRHLKQVHKVGHQYFLLRLNPFMFLLKSVITEFKTAKHKPAARIIKQPPIFCNVN